MAKDLELSPKGFLSEIFLTNFECTTADQRTALVDGLARAEVDMLRLEKFADTRVSDLPIIMQIIGTHFSLSEFGRHINVAKRTTQNWADGDLAIRPHPEKAKEAVRAGIEAIGAALLRAKSLVERQHDPDILDDIRARVAIIKPRSYERRFEAE